MSTIIIDGQRRRVFSAEDLPLSIGGTECHIAVTGLEDEEIVGYLGLDGNDFFVQPTSEPIPSAISCNGLPLNTSRWIAGGDELTIGTARLRFEHASGVTRVRIEDGQKHDEESATQGSPIPPPSSDRVISPVEFTPRWQSPPRRAGFTIRPRTVLLSAIIVALAIGAWFVVTARAVRVETSPTADNLTVRGAALTPKIDGRYLLRPGEYVVSAKLDGYMDLEAALEVGPDTPATVSYSMEPLGADVSFRSKPVSGAEVLVDSVDVGVTPLDGLQLSAGDHTIEIRAPLHLPFQRDDLACLVPPAPYGVIPPVVGPSCPCIPPGGGGR